MNRALPIIIVLLGIILGANTSATAQTDADLPDPKIAFLKSLAVPGWGHYYVNKSNWTRGQYHLAAEATLILSYFGFSIHSNNLQQNWYSYGRAKAGVPIEGRSRRFQLAVGDFDNLQAYNDYQLRRRNWDRLFENTPENQWNWDSPSERSQYEDIRSRFERIDQQLPALLALMAVNRVISGISAYNRAQKQAAERSVSSAVYLSPYHFTGGIVANVKVGF